MRPKGSSKTPRETIVGARVCVLRCVSVRGWRVRGPRKTKNRVFVGNATGNAYPRAENPFPTLEKTQREPCMFAIWRVAELLREGVRY